MTAGNAQLAGRAMLVAYDLATQHNVPGVFVDYREKAGLQTIGFAISEPFGATVKVAGQQRGVLIQVFEQRVLTFMPTNDPAFQVEMGNIGQHYQWRYTGGPVSGKPPAGTTQVLPGGLITGSVAPPPSG